MRGKNSARWHCRACNKTAFGSQGRAEETIDRASGFRGNKKPVRAYQCPYGNGWHLTSQKERV